MIQNVNNKFQNTTPPYSELKGFSKEVLQFVNHYNFNNNNEIKDSFQKHFTSKRLIVYADVAFVIVKGNKYSATIFGVYNIAVAADGCCDCRK